MEDTLLQKSKPLGLMVGVDAWNEWRKIKNCDWLSFLVTTSDIDEDYYTDIRQTSSESASSRKLTAIFPAFITPNSRDVNYGWTLTEGELEPVKYPSSVNPYPVQIGFIPGALIKKSILEALNFNFTGDIVDDSVRLSLEIWNRGLNSLINPSVVIRTGIEELEYPLDVEYTVSEGTKKTWHREVVG